MVANYRSRLDRLETAVGRMNGGAVDCDWVRDCIVKNATFGLQQFGFTEEEAKKQAMINAENRVNFVKERLGIIQ